MRYVINWLNVLLSSRAEPLSFRAIKDLAISHSSVRSVGRVVYAFSGRTFCQLASQKDDYLSALLINRLFGGAKSLIARKDRGSAQVVVLGTLNNQGLLSDFVSMYDTVDGSVW